MAAKTKNVLSFENTIREIDESIRVMRWLVFFLLLLLLVVVVVVVVFFIFF